MTHVEAGVDPVADAETIETELMLADIESIEKRLQGAGAQGPRRRQGRRCSRKALKQALCRAGRGQAARSVAVAEDDARTWKSLQLLTTKPVLYVCNVAEEDAASGNAHSRPSPGTGRLRGQCHRGDLGQDRGRDQPARR
ncbi:MAG: hypothetical protein R3D85_15395 [Paracoccaceae bacterium]